MFYHMITTLLFIPNHVVESRVLTRLTASMNLSQKIRSALTVKYNEPDVLRIKDCWDRFSAGKSFKKNLDATGEIVQTAECYVEGLTPRKFHDIKQFTWALGLQQHYREILSEVNAYDLKQKESKTSLWLGARDTAGASYGPEWKTLGLQDRSVWDEERMPDFPRTVQVLKDLSVPSVEVFFARQGPNSGIKPHSDKNNFIITCHLGLDVPEGQAWIQVGDEKYYWKNGEAVIFDTSIVHCTRNDASSPRLVLLIRFWHPELTLYERDALNFIFAYLDHASLGDEALEWFEYKHLFLGKDNHKGLGSESDTVRENVPQLGAKVGEKLRGASTTTSKPKPKGFGQSKK